MSNKIVVELTTGPDSDLVYFSEEKIFKVEGVLEGPVVYYTNACDIENGQDETSKNYCCSLCNRSFSRKGDLLRHVRTHSGEKPFDCPDCGEEFTRKDDMYRHFQTHTGIKPYSCKLCEHQFSRKADLQKHYLKHKRKAFRCSKCNECFPLKRHLVNHMKTHANVNEFSCKECGKRFSQRKGTLKLKKDGGKKYYICVSCSNKTKKPEENAQEKPFQCPECGDGFGRKSDMVRHLRLHTGVKPFACETCSKSFSRKEDMLRHCLTRHNKEKLNFCSSCGEGFSRKLDLQEHMLSHHVELLTEENVDECASAILRKITDY